MAQTISLQFEDISEYPTEIETVDSSGDPKSANPFYVLVGTFRSTIAHIEETISSVLDALEVSNSLNDVYKTKEKEWHQLIGEDRFQSLDKESRDFLINTAGTISFGVTIDIKKTYQYYTDEE